MFLTTTEFLPQHHAQRRQTLELITTAEARGQQRLAEMNRTVLGNLDDAVSGYARYQQAAQIQAGTMDPRADHLDSGGSDPHPAPDGAGGTEESGSAGQDRETRSPADTLATAAAEPAGAGGLGEVAGSLMGSVLPAVLGGVSGAAGGLLGALSGAGQQLQQAGSQLARGLAQGANAAMSSLGDDKPAGGGGQPQTPQPDGLDAGGGGPEPGDMEPAGGVGAAGTDLLRGPSLETL